MKSFLFRQRIQHSDVQAIAGIVQSTGFFSSEELHIAEELAQEKLKLHQSCSYQFLFAEKQGQVVGYTCYGPIPATQGSYDIYWIVVAKTIRVWDWERNSSVERKTL